MGSLMKGKPGPSANISCPPRVRALFIRNIDRGFIQPEVIKVEDLTDLWKRGG